MESYIAYALALSVCLVAVIAIVSLTGTSKRIRSIGDSASARRANIKSTYFLDTTALDKKCEICFGELDDGDVRACDCGKVFHISCSDLTGECPYCKKKIGEMTVRRTVKAVCPGCGNVAEDSICRCGIVLPDRDGTFDCRCGSRISITDDECPYCGAVYSTRPGKELKPRPDDRLWS
jgi:hypothetical protein